MVGHTFGDRMGDSIVDVLRPVAYSTRFRTVTVALYLCPRLDMNVSRAFVDERELAEAVDRAD